VLGVGSCSASATPVPKKSFDWFSEERELIIAAERRHVYSYAASSYDFSKERNGEHFALCLK
jgi:hypothetical protein